MKKKTSPSARPKAKPSRSARPARRAPGSPPEVRSIVLDLGLVPWRTLAWFQPEALKIQSEELAAKLGRSLVASGFAVPFHVWKRPGGETVILDGHLRKRALETLAAAGTGIPEELPAVFLDVGSEAEAKRLVLVFNSHYAKIDRKTVFDWLGEGVDLAELSTSINLPSINLIPKADEDDPAPAPPKKPVSKPGDLWRLGEHVLGVGDSTDPAFVGRLLGARPELSPSIMVTDPPYGVEYEPSWRAAAAKAGGIRYGAERVVKVANDSRADWTPAFRLFPGAVAYVWCASLFSPLVARNLEEVGFELRAQIIWKKDGFAISRGHYHWSHEPAWYAVRSGASADWRGGRAESTVWEIPRSSDGDKNGHGTQKPIEAMSRPMRNHAPGPVFDPFLGSGSTLVAAEKLGSRPVFGADLDPAWVDVAIERWERLTGGRATNVETGRPFRK